MSNIITPKARLSWPHTLTQADREARQLRHQCGQWRAVALEMHPGRSRDLVETVQQEMLRRANKLGEQGPISAHKVAEYFLKVSAEWLLAGTPPEKIMGMLPKTLDDLGYMVIKEGAPDSGQKLTGKELKRASLRGGKLIQ